MIANDMNQFRVGFCNPLNENCVLNWGRQSHPFEEQHRNLSVSCFPQSNPISRQRHLHTMKIGGWWMDLTIKVSPREGLATRFAVGNRLKVSEQIVGLEGSSDFSWVGRGQLNVTKQLIWKGYIRICILAKQ